MAELGAPLLPAVSLLALLVCLLLGRRSGCEATSCRSPRPRAFAFMAALAIAVAFTACGGGGDGANDGTGAATTGPADSPESAGMGGKVPTIVIRNGEPVGGIKELEYDAGDEIRFEVTSDVADEVHVHGYDLMQDVPAGGTVSFDFLAEIEGIFEAELEGRKEQIAEIRVNP